MYVTFTLCITVFVHEPCSYDVRQKYLNWIIAALIGFTLCSYQLTGKITGGIVMSGFSLTKKG